MTLQLWTTTIVAVVAQIVTVVNGITLARMNARMSARNADRQAVRARELDRREARRRDLEEAFDRFLAAARALTGPLAATAESGEKLGELRSALVRIERLAPSSADRAVIARHRVEELVRLRSEGMWSDAVGKAEKTCEDAISALRGALVAELDAL